MHVQIIYILGMEKLIFEDFVNRENLNTKEKGDLILFDYNKTIQFKQDWDEISLQARGIVFDKKTGELIARPFKKFHNWEELQGNGGINLPLRFRPNFDGPFTVLEKMDGSMGVCYWYKGEWHINTRGSFESDQAIWAKDWFDKNINSQSMNPENTYLFEIIYTDNKIVVDYGKKESLVLIGIINKETGYEHTYSEMDMVYHSIGSDICHMYHFDKLEDIFDARNALTMNEEGYVITFKNGYKFKLKGEAYCKVHRALCALTPLHFWRAIDLNDFKIPMDFIEALPEEFKETVDSLKEITEKSHQEAYDRILELSHKVPSFDKSDNPKKDRYMWLEENLDSRDVGGVLGILDGKEERLKKKIHSDLRPTNNNYDNIKMDKRLLRIIQELG